MGDIMSRENLEKKIREAWQGFKELTDEQMNCEHDYSGCDRKGIYYDHCGVCRFCGIDSDDDLESEQSLHFHDGYQMGYIAALQRKQHTPSEDEELHNAFVKHLKAKDAKQDEGNV